MKRLKQGWIATAIMLMLSTLACNFPSRTSQTLSAPLTATLELAVADVIQPTIQPSVQATIQSTIQPTITDVPTVVAVIPTLVPSPTLYIPSAAPTPAATGFNEPSGCQRPPDDYTRIVINGERLNYRTVAMLRRAQELYGGTIEFAGWAITQGSYNPGGVSASFGTHDGGGAVDISVRSPRTGAILTNELEDAIRALRVAGFAAWVRETGELYANSPIHIHAIAIGDSQLSPAASEQLTGKYAYFKGYNGLPKPDEIPVADRHGGPVFCQWMFDLGYRDLRGQ